MKKLFLFILPLFVASFVFLGFVFLVAKGATSKGALQVTSVPKSKVYLNDQFIGETPLCKCEGNDMLSSGDYSLKVVPDDSSQSPYSENITLGKQTLTVIDRTFDGSTSSEGSLIYLKDLADSHATELFVSSFPDKADVLVDNTLLGETPFLSKTLTASDHTLTIRKIGYRSKILHIHTTAGYQLVAVGYLGVDLTKKVEGQEDANALDVGSVSLTPSASLSPSISPVASVKVVILPTDIGYVRVRSDATTSSSQSGQVTQGETFDLLAEKSGWYQIKLQDGTLGWVSAQYANKKE